MRTFEHIGIGIPQVYLPAKGVDLAKWAVVACDQYTSEPEYWEQVERIVGDSASTLRLVLPEIYIGTAEEAERTRDINLRMQEYLEQGLLVPHEGIFTSALVWQQVPPDPAVPGPGKIRFRRLAQLIRATEGTIVERLPPHQIRDRRAWSAHHCLDRRPRAHGRSSRWEAWQAGDGTAPRAL
jgi:hypothetical protein